MVVRLIVECLQPENNMSIYDPTCGSGGMLLESIHYMERKGLNPRSVSLYGQEINLNTWAICKMNLFLHGIDDAEVLKGDTLRNPRHLQREGSKSIKRFDRCWPIPISLKSWARKYGMLGSIQQRQVWVPS